MMGDDAGRYTMAQFLRMRGVEMACDRCHGMGVRMYSSTATWRGGMGGASMTRGTCDKCWGSGDAHRRGPDIRALEAKRAGWERKQVMVYLSHALGVRVGRLRSRIAALAELADTQSRRRKVPDGEDTFWWSRDWEAVAGLLRRIARDEEGDDG